MSRHSQIRNCHGASNGKLAQSATAPAIAQPVPASGDRRNDRLENASLRSEVERLKKEVAFHARDAQQNRDFYNDLLAEDQSLRERVSRVPRSTSKPANGATKSLIINCVTCGPRPDWYFSTHRGVPRTKCKHCCSQQESSRQKRMRRTRESECRRRPAG